MDVAQSLLKQDVWTEDGADDPRGHLGAVDEIVSAPAIVVHCERLAGQRRIDHLRGRRAGREERSTCSASGSGRQILVTGGCADIGRLVIPDLIGTGADVVIFDVSDHSPILSDLAARDINVSGDIEDGIP
jgi:FlaA1/EpsC-like NDP-sugar epimerase